MYLNLDIILFILTQHYLPRIILSVILYHYSRTLSDTTVLCGIMHTRKVL